MTLYIQDNETGNVIYQTDDFECIPNVDEEIMVEGNWYKVNKRHFYFKHLTNIDDNSVSLFVTRD